MFRALSLDDLLRDDVTCAKQDSRRCALCRKWPLKEQVTL